MIYFLWTNRKQVQIESKLIVITHQFLLDSGDDITPPDFLLLKLI
ncbi:hypothetical protein [Coxiella-like endosymbiont]|nr:hypothetical protein [Coxiella-like endosymbiont]